MISAIQNINEEGSKSVYDQIVEEEKQKLVENDEAPVSGQCLNKEKSGQCPNQEERRNSNESVQPRRQKSEPKSPGQNSEKSRSKGGVCPFGFHLLGANLSQREENKIEMVGKDKKNVSSARNKSDDNKDSLEMEYQGPCQMTFDCKEDFEGSNHNLSNLSAVKSILEGSGDAAQPENQTPGTLVNVAINAFKDFNRN